MFDKQINVRMGQANVKRWIDDILPLLTGEEDPLGVDDYGAAVGLSLLRNTVDTPSSD